jgi:hypothetical protein
MIQSRIHLAPVRLVSGFSDTCNLYKPSFLLSQVHSAASRKTCHALLRAVRSTRLLIVFQNPRLHHRSSAVDTAKLQNQVKKMLASFSEVFIHPEK